MPVGGGRCAGLKWRTAADCECAQGCVLTAARGGGRAAVRCGAEAGNAGEAAFDAAAPQSDRRAASARFFPPNGFQSLRRCVLMFPVRRWRTMGRSGEMQWLVYSAA